MLNNSYKIMFPPEYQGQWEEECVFKGWLSSVIVRFDEGRSYSIIFVDVARLSQMLEDQLENGFSCYAEPGLVVVPEVNRSNVEAAVRELAKENFFDSLRPSVETPTKVL